MRARFCLVCSRRARAALKVSVMSDALFEMPTPPPSLRKAIAILEFPTVLVAKLGAWVILPMTGALVYEVISRYIFNAPTMWAYDITYLMAGTLFMLGSAYALRQGSHVRADFLLSAQNPRWQAMVDVALYLAVYFPATALFFNVSMSFAFQSWQQGETFPQSPWMPIIYPLKTVMPVTLFLLFVQGIAELLKALWTVRTNVRFKANSSHG
jgi:TRAP-type mannitol/chloroaromatic compound transport system permease small subunit